MYNPLQIVCSHLKRKKFPDMLCPQLSVKSLKELKWTLHTTASPWMNRTSGDRGHVCRLSYIVNSPQLWCSLWVSDKILQCSLHESLFDWLVLFGWLWCQLGRILRAPTGIDCGMMFFNVFDDKAHCKTVYMYEAAPPSAGEDPPSPNRDPHPCLG